MPPQKTLNEFFQDKYGIAVPEKPNKKDWNNKKSVIIIPEEPRRKLNRKDKKEEKIFMDTMMYAMAAPTVWPNDWSTTYPQSVRDTARIWRTAEAIKCIDNEQCPDYDAMLYVSCASLNAPPNRDAYCIAMHCIEKYYDLEMIATNIEEDLTWLKRDADLSHNESARMLLANLKRYIFKCQMSHIKSMK